MLEIVGVGFRAAVKGDVVDLTLGFSHPVQYKLPAGVKAEVDKEGKLSVKSADKSLLGKVAADIRGFRPPEPYKGKGVRYQGEADHSQGRQGSRQEVASQEHHDVRVQRTDPAAPQAQHPPSRQWHRGASHASRCFAAASISTPRSSTTPSLCRLSAVSSLTKEISKENGAEKTKREMAELVGASIAKACLAKRHHQGPSSTATATSTTGRVQALADGARKAGLDF